MNSVRLNLKDLKNKNCLISAFFKVRRTLDRIPSRRSQNDSHGTNNDKPF